MSSTYAAKHFTSLHIESLLSHPSIVHMHRNITQLPRAQCGTMYALVFFVVVDFELLVDVSSNTDLHDVIYIDSCVGMLNHCCLR